MPFCSFSAFRQLFGYTEGLCMSMTASPLSLSMMAQQAQLSMSLAPLSLSLVATGMMPFEKSGNEIGIMYPQAASTSTAKKEATAFGDGANMATEASSSQVSDESVNDDPPSTASSSRLGVGAAVGVAAVGAVAAVGLVAAAIIAKSQRDPASASSAGSVSVGSFQAGDVL